MAKYATDAEKVAALSAANKRAIAKHKAKVKNISVDNDLVEMLNKRADLLADQFGFRPTLSQTLRYLLRVTLESNNA